MPLPGNFDAELNSFAWVSPDTILSGWWDYVMPFDHPLIDFSSPPPPPPPPGAWVFVSNWG